MSSHPTLDVDVDVAGALGLGVAYSGWIASLAAIEPRAPAIEFPSPDRCAQILARLGCQEADIEDVLATMPSAERTPALWWLLERCHQDLLRSMGDPDVSGPTWPELPAHLGIAGRCFYLHLYVAVFPQTRTWHQARGIPDQVSWATLSDLGRHVAIHRRVNGSTGITVPSWMTLHLRGLIYEIGRLQYNMFNLAVSPNTPPQWFDETTSKGMGPGFRSGDPALGIHIPEGSPLTLEACAESLRDAAAFFAAHFPVRTRRIATCTSWLLDDQLAQYLPPDSNIVQFQGLFSLVPGWLERDQDIFTFVFRDTPSNLDSVPQRTTLERAVVDHMRNGGHWRVRTGWLDPERTR